MNGSDQEIFYSTQSTLYLVSLANRIFSYFKSLKLQTVEMNGRYPIIALVEPDGSEFFRFHLVYGVLYSRILEFRNFIKMRVYE